MTTEVVDSDVPFSDNFYLQQTSSESARVHKDRRQLRRRDADSARASEEFGDDDESRAANVTVSEEDTFVDGFLKYAAKYHAVYGKYKNDVQMKASHRRTFHADVGVRKYKRQSRVQRQPQPQKHLCIVKVFRT